MPVTYINRLLPFTPTADHTGKEGYGVKNSSGSVALVDGATDAIKGVITEGKTTSNKDTVALLGYSGVIPFKLNSSPGTVNPFTVLQLCADGTFKADTGTGARVLVGEAVQSGVADELVPGILYARPIVIAAQTQTALTDSSGGTPGATLAAITQAANAGSADVAPVKNAIASLAAELALIKADVAVALAR